MVEALSALFSGDFGCFTVVPAVLSLVAIIDAFRVRADWYWFMIIFWFPVVGAIAYFVVVRSPLLGARNVAMMSPAAARRMQARRRLRELNVQLSHWRGPAVLAEAGEELFVLGKTAEAEKLLRESQQNGGAVEDVNFPLAQVLEVQGRWAEAVPLLEELCKAEPDARLGQGPLHLGRSLDEAGRKDEAEAVLRRVLDRRTVIEAQVRLARILLLQGQRDEAGQLLAEIAADAKVLPRYLKRQHRAWIGAAAGLKSGTARLPRPRFEGASPPGYRLKMGLLAGAAALVVLLVVAYLSTSGWFFLRARGSMEALEERAELAASLDALEDRQPWTRGDDLSEVDLDAATLDDYLRLRRALAPGLRRLASHRRRFEATQEKAASGGVLALADVQQRWEGERTAFLRTFIGELTRAAMGPRTFDHLTDLVEWRFLRRPGAMVFAVPDYHRADWVMAQATAASPALEVPEDAPFRREYEQRRRQAAAKLADYQRQAHAAVDLSPATRELLESRRGDLERLNPDDAAVLIHALDPGLQWP